MRLFKNFSYIVFSMLAIFLVSCASSSKVSQMSFDSEEILVMEGHSEYNERNINEMREKAVYDAKLKAVKRMAEFFADDSYKADGKYEILESLVNEDPDFFIRKYKLLKEGPERDKYFAKAQIILFPAKIASAVRAKGLVSKISGPKAALFVEENPDGLGFAKEFVAALSKDSVMSIQQIPVEKAGDGSYDALYSAASEIEAEMYIRVKAKSYIFNSGGLVSNFFPAAAEGSAEVVQVPSGKRLSDISRQGTGNDSSKEAAMRKSMESLASTLAKDTAIRVDPQIKSDPVIKLTFTYLSGIEQAETIKSDLLKLNFKYVSADSYSGGTAVFSVVTKTQDTQEIASIILRGSSLGLQLGSATGKEITFLMAY